MFKKMHIILLFLILGFACKAQNWMPLDTGIHSFIPYGLMADNLRGNLIAFGNKFTIKGLDVWRKNKWELWYPNIELSTYGEYCTYYNNKVIFFKYYKEGNDNAKPRTAILQFTDSMDLDTVKILQNQAWLPYLHCTYNGKMILGATASIGINSIATFDGDTIISIGYPTIESVNAACVYKGELYLSAFLMDGYRGIIKFTSTGYQKIYQIQGSLSSINNMIVYNNRLYIYGGLFLAESPDNIGNNIIAYDGVNFDTLQGGVINEYNTTNGGVSDAVVCNNKLYVTGNFTKAGGAKARGFAYWNDTTWCTIYKDLDSTGNFFRVECFNDTIYQVANFHNVNGSNLGWLAKLHNMSLADTCSAPRYPKPVHYNFENLICIPNPFTDNITVQIPSTYSISETKFIITNNLGQILLTYYPDSYIPNLNLSFLSSGMYYLTIQDNYNKKTAKIIKQ